MAIHNSPEERQIVKLLEKLPIPEAERQAWIDEIQSSGMTEELATQIHDRLNAPGDGEEALPNRTTHILEFTQAIRHWRLALGAKRFK
jgi:hypothetical protein